MAETLAQGNDAIALLANAVATGVMLTVLITVIRPLSGAHLNPAVTFAFSCRKEIPLLLAALYMFMQILGGISGTWLAHVMFDLDILQTSNNSRLSVGSWIAEVVATFGLVATVLGTLRVNPHWIAPNVGLYIAGAYWFAASTSFANPAVTIARCLTESFSGIAPVDAIPFVLAQLIGALVAVACFSLLPRERDNASQRSIGTHV